MEKLIYKNHHLEYALDSFMRGGKRWFYNEWLKFSDFEFYVRKTTHDKARMAISGLSILPMFSTLEEVKLLEFASANIKPRMKRKGWSKKFITACENIARKYDYDAVFIELAPPILAPYLLKQGYIRLAGDYSECFIKPVRRITKKQMKTLITFRVQFDIFLALCSRISVFFEIKKLL